MCHTKSQETKAHDNLLAGHHPCDDPAQHAVVADECDECLGEFSIAADVHGNTAVEHGDGLTANMRKDEQRGFICFQWIVLEAEDYG